jgi:hypothetical protein
MLKYLRMAVTALGLTACLLLVALWVRSYTWRDELGVLFDGNSKLALLQSHPGRLNASLNHAGSDTFSQEAYSQIISTQRWTPPRDEGFRPFVPRIWAGVHSNGIELPYWLLICAAGTLATIPWLRWSRRFSLRTLLIATRLVAVGLGIVVMAT